MIPLEIVFTMKDFIILISFLGGLFLFMLLMGTLFQNDLDDMEKTNPEYRKHLKDKYNL
jgi:hypothetical protein